ncbi:MAG: hypothetical protein MZV70_00175 [Desulfobacterales bacterium]|nr:hypothetical protein [Desulfobacterales bacterium]
MKPGEVRHPEQRDPPGQAHARSRAPRRMASAKQPALRRPGANPGVRPAPAHCQIKACQR